MDIGGLSSRYTVKTVTEGDIPAVYQLAQGNPLYYYHCPPEVTCDSIRRDMKALPPGKTCEDKYYIGFWEQDTLIAVMDLILKYPNEDTAFVGFFMVNQDVQHQGIGSAVITEVCGYLRKEGYTAIRLGYVKGNPQSEGFWTKNQFVKTGLESQEEHYVVVIMERTLDIKRNCEVMNI